MAETTQAPSRWLKVSDVAKITNMGRTKIYELMDAGSLKSLKVGGSRRITESALAEFMASYDGNGHIVATPA